MKKFLIAILFLIPIVVVLAIQGAGYAIEAWAGEKINATRVEVRDEFNEIVEDRIIVPRFDSGNSGNDGYSVVYIDVYPKITYDDTVKYECSEAAGYDGECELVRVEEGKNKYRIVAKKNGTVQMKIYSVTNENAYTVVNIYITSDKITDFIVYGDKGNDGTVDALSQWEHVVIDREMKLYAYAQPLEAIGDNLVVWSIRDSGVATIDKNGLISPLAQGETVVTVSIKDKTGEEYFFDFYLTVDIGNDDFLLFRSEIYLVEDDYGDYTLEEMQTLLWTKLVQGGASCEYTAENIYLLRDEGNVQVYSLGEREIKVNFCQKDAIHFVSKYINDVYVENGGYYLEVDYCDLLRNGTPNVRFVVADMNIFTVGSDGLIEPKAEGTTTVYAVDTITGEQTDSMTVTIKKRIASFELNLTAYDNSRGILQERKWGEYWIGEDNQLTNVYKLGYNFRSVYPDTSYFDLQWISSDEASAPIDSDGNITFMPESKGKDIKITAVVLVHGIVTNLRREYTFRMAEVVAVNAYSLRDLQRINSDEFGKKATCMHADILNDVNNGGTRRIEMSNSLFGNGHTFSTIGLAEDYKYGDILAWEQYRVNPDITELLIENYVTEADDSLKEKMYGNNFRIADMAIPTTFRGNVARYSWTGISIKGGRANNTVTVESNILGQSINAGIYIADHYGPDDMIRDTIIIQNNVFRSSSCSAVCTTPDGLDIHRNDEQYLPHIVFDGFMDCYNWKKVTELGGMYAAVAPNLGELSDASDLFTSIFGDYLDQVIHGETLRQYIYTDENGEEWICMGLFALGLCNRIEAESFEVRDESIKVFQMSMTLSAFEKALLKSIIELEKPNYFLTYKFDKNRGPRLKPNDACPENKELYDRLTAGE